MEEVIRESFRRVEREGGTQSLDRLSMSLSVFLDLGWDGNESNKRATALALFKT